MTDINERRDRIERWAVLGLALAAVGLYVWSYFLPYWKFTLMAPQYPDGLTVDIFLNHLAGDVREVNGLNHYIGMRPLDEAASLERSLAGWAIGLLSLAVVLLTLLPGRKFSWLPLVPAFLFPLGFMADSFYWLYTFGNNLDPKAPINIDPFTPTLLGKGEVGQFETIALPGVGFYMTIGALVLLAVAVWLRLRACRRCALREQCEASCPRFVVGSESQSVQSEEGGDEDVTGRSVGAE